MIEELTTCTCNCRAYKKQGIRRKSYMVIYENIKVIESAIDVYGNMQVIDRP